MVRSRKVLALSFLALGGCGGMKSLTLSTDKELNPNSQGQSLPVGVRVYHLKGERHFMEMPVDKFFENDKGKEALGDDWISLCFDKDIYPDQREVPIPLGELGSETRFIGIFVRFDQWPDGVKERVSIPAVEAGKHTWVLKGFTIGKKP